MRFACDYSSIWSSFRLISHFHSSVTKERLKFNQDVSDVYSAWSKIVVVVVGVMNYTIVMKCSGNPFLYKIASLCGSVAKNCGRKMCCFLLMTTRNEKCVVRCLVLLFAPVNTHMSLALATQHIEHRFFFIILHFNNRAKKFWDSFFLCVLRWQHQQHQKKVVEGNKKLFSWNVRFAT